MVERVHWIGRCSECPAGRLSREATPSPRLHLVERSPNAVGWLFALADPQMRAVISAMHEKPARRWTLEDLARTGGMSRSSFAVRFK
jgi:AraC-like DNA-binding protein